MNKPNPILHIYQDGDQFFVARPDFIDLQVSSVVWLKTDIIDNLLLEFRYSVDTTESHSAPKISPVVAIYPSNDTKGWEMINGIL